MMRLGIMLLVASVIGAVFLLRGKPLTLPVLALVASGLLLARALHWTSFSLPGISLSLLLGGTLAVTGVLLLLRVRVKAQVVAATIVAFVGVIHALTALGVLH